MGAQASGHNRPSKSVLVGESLTRFADCTLFNKMTKVKSHLRKVKGKKKPVRVRSYNKKTKRRQLLTESSVDPQNKKFWKKVENLEGDFMYELYKDNTPKAKK